MSALFWINLLAFLFSFFVAGALLGALFSPPVRKKVVALVRELKARRDIALARTWLNPILAPSHHLWEVEATFNPAALILGDRTHLLYRAIGADGVSRLGYASSANGLYFDERLPYPVYVAQNPRLGVPGHRRYYAPHLYPSGGSWGGCEDPRMVAIEDKVYVTFSLFDGWDFIRMGMISIPEQDFRAKRFYNWSPVTLLSPPGQIHKNWVLFPEKLRGKFAVIHSITPKVEVAYVDSLEDIGNTAPFIQSWTGARDARKGREGFWDNHVRGAGPPPLRTEEGWLLFYHAVDENDPGRYKLGIMLLDLDEPTTVLHRSNVPILAPDERYENEGKPGVVYACGATIRNEMLHVYYGGADKVVCVAFAPLHAFLTALKSGEHAILRRTELQTD